MTYASIADVADSASLTRRITACAAQEQAPGDPGSWAYQHRWDWAASPGWADKWDSAIASAVEDPGADPAVITDGDILTVTQALIAAGA